jgi:hypothetical protein
VTGDIKTGSLTVDRGGTPKYWVKYGPQTSIYASGELYDVDTDTRVDWDPHPPRQDVAFIFHYDLAAALDGETVAWSAIPVNLHAAREGVRVAAEARAYAKRRDVFGAAVELASGRRTRLRDRYHQLAECDQERFVALDIDPDDLDAVEAGLDQVDPFAQVSDPQPRKRGAA